MTVGIAVFLLSIAGWVGVLLYQSYIQEEIHIKSQELSHEMDLINTSVVDRLTQVDNQIDSSEELLNRHIAPTILFSKLSDMTIQGVRYNSFSYEGNPLAPITVSLSGEAHDFSTLVQQADSLERDPFASSTEFSSVTKSDEGDRVGFGLTMTIRPDEIRYKKLIRPSGTTTAQAF